VPKLNSLKNRRLWIFLIGFISYGYFFQGCADNENARFDEIRALTQQHQLNIDSFAHNTSDAFSHSGHSWSTKAPGTTFFGALPWIGIVKGLTLFGVKESLAYQWACYLTTWILIGGMSALLSVLLFDLLLAFFEDVNLALLLTFAHGYATIAFPYSTVFFSHQLTSCLVVGMFHLLYLRGKKNTKQLYWSGLLGGLAFITEYTAAVPVGLILIYAWITIPEKTRSTTLLIAGFVTALLPHFVYGYWICGNIAYIPYGVLSKIDSQFPGHRQGIMGIKFPSFEVLKKITFDPERGLFYSNPWLIFLIPSLAFPMYTKKYREEYSLFALISVAMFCYNAGYGDSITYWGGGASVGPRHLTIILPFATILIGSLFQFRLFRILTPPLILLSSNLMLMAVAVEPRPWGFANPMKELFWEAYHRGTFNVFDRSAFSSDPLSGQFVATNMGRFLGVPREFELIPLLFVWICGVGVLIKPKTILKRKSILLSLLWVVFFFSIPILYRYQYHSRSDGLFATYFKGLVWSDATTRAQIPAKIYSQVKAIPRLGEIPVQDNFITPYSILFSAELIITKQGKYLFSVESDDGSALFIDEKLVVSDWGMHSVRTAQGEIVLSKGKHAFFIRYQNVIGRGILKLNWKAPDEQESTMSSELFLPVFNPAVSDLR